MQQYQCETLLALDSCVLVGALKSPNVAQKILRLFRGNHSRIVLQDVVLKESQRILSLSKEDIIKKIGLMFRKEISVFTTTDDIRRTAKRIENQYGICHCPDSIILSAAKFHSWTLLSMDKDLLRIADFEGILAFNPLKIRRL